MTGNNGIRDIWPEWQIEEPPLGRGSYGVVYKAVRRDHNVESYAAIKVISIPSDQSELDSLRSEGLNFNESRTYLQNIVNDFVSEIQLMESLKGIQNIVSVEDYKVVEKTDGIGWDIYIRMELLTSFNSYKCDKILTEEDVIKLGCDICTALEICNKRNIIHRDIKPENIFVNDFGYFKLGDFGIARQLEHMSVSLSRGKGTPNYMAPEVFNGDDYDARVDICSIGLVLYFLMNGNRLPFCGEKKLLTPLEREEALKRRLRGEDLPAPRDASPEMANLILRACAFDPEKRFASATEMKQALMAISSGNYQVVEVDTLNKTTKVRKAAKTTEQKSKQSVNTFGSVPEKKSKLSGVIAVLLTIAILIGVAIFALPGLIDGNNTDNFGENSGESTTETVVYSKLDEERIASIISEADALAVNEDYEGALKKIQIGLVTYPQASDLQSKADEYTEALNAQIKEKTLAEAKTLADSGDYVAAMALIKTAQDTHGDDEDYQNAYSEYQDAHIAFIIRETDEFAAEEDYESALVKIQAGLAAYPQSTDLKNKSDEYTNALNAKIKKETLAEAKALADSGDYVAAMALIKTAQDTHGDDEDYQNAYNGYQNAHISSIISEAEILAVEEDYEGALVKIQVGLVSYPQAPDLKKKSDEYKKARNAKIKEQTLAEAKVLADSGDYASAISVIKNAQKTQGDNAEYQVMLQNYSSVYKSEVIVESNTLSSIGNYIEAITIINNAKNVIGEDSELISLKKEYEDLYVSSVITDVDVLITQGEKDSARNLLENAIQVVPGNIYIQAKIDSLVPKCMTDILPTYQWGGNTYREYSGKKSGNTKYFYMAGIKYYNGMTFNGDKNMYHDSSWAVYYLNNEYSKLEFTIGHVDGTFLGYENTLKVFYDGLLVEEIELTPDMMPKFISLDVSNVSQLKFQLGISGNDGPVYGLGNPELFLSGVPQSQPNNNSTEKNNMTDILPAYQWGGNTYREYSGKKSGNAECFYMAGIKYYNGMTFDGDKNMYHDSSWAVYNLNKEYSKLEFTICHVDWTFLGYENALKVFFDGILVEEIELTPDMAPKFISLDVSNVSQLKFQLGISGNDGPIYGIGNPILE